jgi:hypothetical protein
MMPELLSRVRRADGELVPLRAAAAGRRKSASGGDARGPSARDGAQDKRGADAEVARRRSMRVALVWPGSAAQQQPTSEASGVQGARAGPARRGRQVVSAGPRATLRPPRPILHGDRADVPGASRGQRAGAFASGGRGAAQVGVGRRCQRVQPSRRVDGARDKRGAAAEAARRRSVRVVLVRPESAARQQPAAGAGSVRTASRMSAGARAGGRATGVSRPGHRQMIFHRARPRRKSDRRLVVA